MERSDQSFSTGYILELPGEELVLTIDAWTWPRPIKLETRQGLRIGAIKKQTNKQTN